MYVMKVCFAALVLIAVGEDGHRHNQYQIYQNLDGDQVVFNGNVDMQAIEFNGEILVRSRCEIPGLKICIDGPFPIFYSGGSADSDNSFDIRGINYYVVERILYYYNGVYAGRSITIHERSHTSTIYTYVVNEVGEVSNIIVASQDSFHNEFGVSNFLPVSGDSFLRLQ